MKKKINGKKKTGVPAKYFLTYKNITKSIADWARELKVDHRFLTARYKAGWPTEKILFGNKEYFRPFKYVHIPTSEDKAYIAGYFDGEGCLTVAARPQGKGVQVRIDFGQTQPQGVKFMQQIYGGSILKRILPAPRKIRLQYRLSQTNAVLKFIEDVTPYCKEKLEQILIFKKYYKPNLSDRQIWNLASKLSKAKQRRIT